MLLVQEQTPWSGAWSFAVVLGCGEGCEAVGCGVWGVGVIVYGVLCIVYSVE